MLFYHYRCHDCCCQRSKAKSSSSDSGSSDDSDSDSSSDDDPNVKRSSITGKKIKMKVDKTKEDMMIEKGRRELLMFMNSQY